MELLHFWTILVLLKLFFEHFRYWFFAILNFINFCEFENFEVFKIWYLFRIFNLNFEQSVGHRRRSFHTKMASRSFLYCDHDRCLWPTLMNTSHKPPSCESRREVLRMNLSERNFVNKIKILRRFFTFWIFSNDSWAAIHSFLIIFIRSFWMFMSCQGFCKVENYYWKWISFIKLQEFYKNFEAKKFVMRSRKREILRKV